MISGISCVQFDDDHIVSGSSDSTIKVDLKILRFDSYQANNLYFFLRFGISEPTIVGQS